MPSATARSRRWYQGRTLRDGLLPGPNHGCAADGGERDRKPTKRKCAAGGADGADLRAELPNCCRRPCKHLQVHHRVKGDAAVEKHGKRTGNVAWSSGRYSPLARRDFGLYAGEEGLKPPIQRPRPHWLATHSTLTTRPSLR